ncbi:TIGR03086 family protein [Amycolatopsis marina]|uniref:TIGR03086 family protein n=1 Tax=Amycolatopsis marina TaxID=490629 RepID=A0A1I0VV33_9PSEU|nr:maleylpyruvate isomerase family mycothiol-dependent enzyme [Amycolatopsis marina]SFA80202.1 TIGR03086 family protein [Amycolatopsis marina]
MTDNTTVLAQAIDQTNSLVRAVPDDNKHAATPCTDFNVAQLVEHLAVIADRVGTAIAPESTPTGSTWDDAFTRLRPLLGGVDPDRVVDLPFGRLPLGAALGVFVGEFVTHGWDLAVAIGRTDLLDDGLGQHALALVTARIPRDPRTHTPFGEVVSVPADAPVYDRLAGWMGRDPVWRSE